MSSDLANTCGVRAQRLQCLALFACGPEFKPSATVNRTDKAESSVTLPSTREQRQVATDGSLPSQPRQNGELFLKRDTCLKTVRQKNERRKHKMPTSTPI